ncbi:MAG: glycosyltransferase family 9 protein [Anaerolineae bacterium]|nr:glycosyltransferase family 9 protein [Anaerolineae bacterium]
MRLLLILPCCIGDVVLATATLHALRQGFPAAHITWAVGAWSRQVIEDHPALDAILDTGPAALPVQTPAGFWRFVRQVRAGQFDVLVSLVRSPRMSAAALLTGVPVRAGPDSGGRGFGYTLRQPLNPRTVQHEALIYLSIAQRLGIPVAGLYAGVPVTAAARTTISHFIAQHDITGPYLVLHPGGGSNPGMTMDSKRYPPAQMAALANALVDDTGARVILVGANSDQPLIEAVRVALRDKPVVAGGVLSLAELAALAAGARLYIGNDTGLTHLAAASGARTVMIFGPSDPRRYAPFVPPGQALALWRPVPLDARGVNAGPPADWDWSRDGIGVAEALAHIRTFLQSS